MEENEKNRLEITLRTTGFAEVEETSIQELLKVIREGTLGNKVTTAIHQRKQGRFAKAMLNLTEANSYHMRSIQAIQFVLDDIKGVPHTEVGLQKYRQFYPSFPGWIGAW